MKFVFSAELSEYLLFLNAETQRGALTSTNVRPSTAAAATIASIPRAVTIADVVTITRSALIAKPASVSGSSKSIEF